MWQNTAMNRWVIFILVIILGIILGMVFGWVLHPGLNQDTSLVSLRYDYRTDYVLMIAETHSTEGNTAQAVRQLAQLGPESPVNYVIQALAYAAQMRYSPADLILIQNLANALQTWSPTPEGFIP